ncbi:MAG: hypothetical protein J5916_08140 [Oscillospiraceae bacterium]|nr:hypothetical protein [Oscillospiraceae bacterium]
MENLTGGTPPVRYLPCVVPCKLYFLVSTAFLFWKCKYGFANVDESFYLTIPFRLCQGDSLFLHEWHLTQLSSILLYPAMWLYRIVFPDTVGILFHFRLLFTFVWCIVALFIFFRLKNLSILGAMLASLAFLYYAPFGIMALSYNSMGILFLLCACVLAVSSEHSRTSWFFAGFFLAGAVLCCPYLLVLYILLTAAAVASLVWRRKEVMYCWLFVSCGCGLMFILFCLLVFSRATLRDLIVVFPELFRDPEHSNFDFLSKTAVYCQVIWGCNRAFVPGLIVFALSCVLAFRNNGRKIGFVLVCFAAFFILLCFLVEKPYINYLMFPINLPGLYCALISKDQKIRRLFFGLWLPGAIYSFCLHLSSNQEFYAISSASTVMTVASIMILICYLSDQDWQADSFRFYRKAAYFAFALLISVQLCGEIYMRYTSVFWESGMNEQKVLCESGPEKGILMAPEHLQDYQVLENDVTIIQEDKSIQKVLFLSRNTYLYLIAQKEYATYSAWLSGVNTRTMERLDRYYELFPEKTPDGIYIEKKFSDYAAHFLAAGYIADEMPSGALWLHH